MHSNSAEGRIMIYKSQIERLKGFTPFLITAPEGGVLNEKKCKIA